MLWQAIMPDLRIRAKPRRMPRPTVRDGAPDSASALPGERLLTIKSSTAETVATARRGRLAAASALLLRLRLFLLGGFLLFVRRLLFCRGFLLFLLCRLFLFCHRYLLDRKSTRLNSSHT